MATDNQNTLPAQAEHHQQFYFSRGSHIFRVENVLYKLYGEFLSSHSGLFKDLFMVCDPPNSTSSNTTEGLDDEHPIVLEGERSDVFDLFLNHIHGNTRTGFSAYSRIELQDFLKFVDKYRCSRIRQFLITHVWDDRFEFHPAELIQLSCEHKIEKLFRWSFKKLLEMPLCNIGGNHRALMGNDLFITLVYAKAVLDKHCRLIAAEEPPIQVHADECRNPRECAEDWHAAWWNGMGRFLLDGRNPQSFDEAVRHFREMKFGRMSAGCQTRMLHIVDRRDGFRSADKFIDDICQGLVNDLGIQDNSETWVD